MEHGDSNTAYVNLCFVPYVHDVRKTLHNKEQNKESVFSTSVYIQLLIYKAKGQALDLMFQQIAVPRCWQVIWGMWSSKNLWNLSVSPSMRRGNAVLDSTKKRDQPLQVHLWLPQILEKSHKGWGYSGPWTFVAWPSLISSSRFLRIIYNDRERKTTVFDLFALLWKSRAYGNTESTFSALPVC